MKKYLLVALLIVATTTVMGQVGPRTYGNNSGLGIYMGTHSTFGRGFAYHDEQRYEYSAVEPESYKPRLINPILGIGWWGEYPSDDFVFGYQIMGNYGVEKYQVTLDKETLINSRKSLGMNLGCYVGWHFGEQLTACVGVAEETRLPVGNGGKVNIFGSQNTFGLMAMVRYTFAEDYFVSLQGSYGFISWGSALLSEWEKYDPIVERGYYVMDKDLKPLSSMVGVGTGF